MIQRLAGNLQTAQGSFIAGSIRVESQYNPLAKTLEQKQLLLGQRRAHRRNGVGETCLVQTDHIQVAFHNHRLILQTDGFARQVEAVEQMPLIEDRRLGGVQELGHIIRVEDARPEARHAPALVADGEHHAVAETIIEFAPFLPLAEQPGSQEIILRGAALAKIIEGGIPGLRGIAQTKGLDGFVLQTALGAQILQRLLARRRVQQLVAIKRDRIFQQGAQVIMLFRGDLLFGAGRFELYASLVRQVMQRLGKIPVFALHYILEDIPALVALTKTAPGA